MSTILEVMASTESLKMQPINNWDSIKKTSLIIITRFAPSTRKIAWCNDKALNYPTWKREFEFGAIGQRLVSSRAIREAIGNPMLSKWKFRFKARAAATVFRRLNLHMVSCCVEEAKLWIKHSPRALGIGLAAWFRSWLPSNLLCLFSFCFPLYCLGIKEK